MTTTRLWAASLAWLISGVALATPVSVAVDVRGVPTGSKVQVSLMARGEGVGSETASWQVSAPAMQQVDVPKGFTYRFVAKADGYWAEDVVIWVGEAGGAARTKVVLWPVGKVTGRLVAPAGVPIPDVLTLRFKPAAGQISEESPGGEVVCPVRQSLWTCEIPVGVLDVRARAQAFVSHFFWSAGVSKTKTLDLGVLHLRRGGSIVGWVATVNGPADPRTCSVELSRAGVTAGLSKGERERAQQLLLSTRPNDRGFFHLEGVVAGTYVLTAKQPPFAPESREPITVIENAEAELGETLLLRPPAELIVTTRPSRDPWGRPWRIELLRKGLDPIEMEAVGEGELDDTDTWRRGNLQPGQYSIRVLDAAGSAWVNAPIDLVMARQEEEIAIPVVPIEGTVTLGDTPLPAILFFGGARGNVSIKVRTDSSGHFSGSLPREGTWDVTVVSPDPVLKREVSGVVVRRSEATGHATVDVSLPDTRLEGTVVGEDGLTVSGALVTCRSVDARETPTDMKSDEAGKFAFRGMAVGRVVVEAHADSRSSDPMELVISNSAMPGGTTLVIRELKRLTGRVVSASGGVLGAVVAVFPVGRPSSGMEVTTGTNGTFETAVPAWSSQVNIVVMPAGYSLTAQRVQVPQEGSPTLLLRVESAGGFLVVRPPRAKSDPTEFATVLEHNGVPIGLAMLARWATLNRAQLGESLPIPALEAGNYRVCAVPSSLVVALGAGFLPGGAVCSSELFVPPNGEVEVELPSLKPGVRIDP